MNTEPLRVLIIEASGRGFLSHYAHALALGLHNIDVDVQLLTGCRDELAGMHVPYTKSSCLNTGRAGRRCIRKHITRDNPDIVHLQWVDNPFATLGLVRWIRKQGIRVVYTPHNILPHEKRWLLMPAYRLLYKQMDKIVARDHHLAWALEELLDISRDRIALLPGSPNILSLFNQADLASPVDDKRKDEFRLLFFGHGCPRKGLDLLFTTIMRNSDWPNSLHLIVAGEGVLQGIPCEWIERVQDKLRLTVINQYIPAGQVARMFRDADLLLMPYLKLCKSPLLDLAAAFKLPVLRSDRVQGASFIDGQHGATFNHADRDEFALRLSNPNWIDRLDFDLKEETSPVESMNEFAARHRQLYSSILRTANSVALDGPIANTALYYSR